MKNRLLLLRSLLMRVLTSGSFARRLAVVNLFNSLLSVSLMLAAPFVYAQSTATLTQYYTQSITQQTGNATGWQNSASLACQTSYNQSLSYYQTNQPSFGPYTGNIDATTPNCVYWLKGNSGGYVGNKIWTFPYTTQQGTGSLGCPSAGDSRSINMTLGYTHDPSGDKSSSVGTYADKYISMRTAGSMCASGGGSACAVTFDASAPSMVWISASPNAQGLYRISVDQKVIYSGATCTQTANEKMVTESTDAAPACDGIYGVVNGKAVCVPSNSGSRNLVQSQTGTSNTPRQVGNPVAGSNGGLPIASRTPSAGTGSNDGGPVSPLDGSPAPLGSPLPTTPVTKSTVDLQLTGQCGASGQPPCKIDETGTPSVPSMVLDTASLNSQATSQRNTISGTADKGFFNGWSSIFSTPPVTACTPFAYPMSGVTVDPCPVVDGVRTVMAFLWALVGGWICLAWIKEAI